MTATHKDVCVYARVCVWARACHVAAQGLHPSVARRLQDWRFHPDTITLSPSGPLLTSNQTLALSNVLDQLRGLEVGTYTCIHTSGHIHAQT